MDTTYRELSDVENAAGNVMNAATDAAAATVERAKLLAEDASQGVQRAADSLRDSDAADVAGQVVDYFKAHPNQAIIGAAFAGFVVGRLMSRE